MPYRVELAVRSADCKPIQLGIPRTYVSESPPRVRLREPLGNPTASVRPLPTIRADHGSTGRVVRK